MRKYTLVILAVLYIMLSSFQNDKSIKGNDIHTLASWAASGSNTQDKSEDAKKWLLEAINNYFQDLSSMAAITTPLYYEYKSDATAVDSDSDGSLTQEEFENKWKGKFNTEYAGVDCGFLISGQDWGNIIKVTECDLLANEKGTYIFHTVISDVEYEADYIRDIKVIESKGSFLISDIKEYN